MSSINQLRRTDHAITDRSILFHLLAKAPVGRIGVISDHEPYIVPMNFAHLPPQGEQAWGHIILHGANQGRLFQALASSPLICFEVDEFLGTIPNPVLCDYDTGFTSVVCRGTARIIDDLTARTEALRFLARKYAPHEHADALKERTVEMYTGKFEARTAVFEITLHTMTGKTQPMPL